MADAPPANPPDPAAEEKAARAASFGAVAGDYERYRPGPPAAAVDWLLPAPVGTVVDLGAGTGALTRLLVDRADEVVAVEPDDRMRAVLEAEVPSARALAGRGEALPLPDGSADAVVASSSWHWMDPVPTLLEVGRVLRPGGFVAALWAGPDPEGALFVQAQQLLAASSGSELGDMVVNTTRADWVLTIPDGVPFGAPEHHVVRWTMALDADEIVGLLGTLSAVILMEEERRTRLIDEARRLLDQLLGGGGATIDVDFRCEAYRAWRTG